MNEMSNALLDIVLMTRQTCHLNAEVLFHVNRVEIYP